MLKEIARGAEAILWKDGHKLVKDRVKKGYRLPELDKRIRRLRTRVEERLMDRARRAGVDTPRILDTRDSELVMEFIEGQRVKDALNAMKKPDREKVYNLIGDALARLHSANVMHGDLTTSNMIIKNETTASKGGRASEVKTIRIFIIDFGLGKVTERVEDKAVDLFLLNEALKSTHFKYLNESWQYILKVYKQKYSKAGEVLKRLEKIEKRRRYKSG